MLYYYQENRTDVRTMKGEKKELMSVNELQNWLEMVGNFGIKVETNDILINWIIKEADDVEVSDDGFITIEYIGSTISVKVKKISEIYDEIIITTEDDNTVTFFLCD